MAEEEKDQNAGSENTGDDSKKEGEESQKKEPSQQDLEAALKREREKGFQDGIAAQAFKDRQKKREEGEEEEETEEEEDKPLTRKDLSIISDSIRKELHSDVIAQKARSIAGSQVEADLILEIHKNRSFPQGLSLDEQLDEARAIALSKPSMKARMDELARANRGRDNASHDAAGTHRDSSLADEPKISAQDVSAIKAAGYLWDGKAQLYVKKLRGGRTLTYDPKTKTRKVIGG